MSAELLREAAGLMRSRAEAATGVTHHWRRGLAGTVPSPVVLCGQVHIAQTDETLTGGPSNAEHIASWHPAVALAVADWLDKVATIREDAPTILGKAADVFTGYDDEAVAVARVYLGRTA